MQAQRHHSTSPAPERGVLLLPHGLCLTSRRCMTPLLVHFHDRNQAAFQRQLAVALPAEVNARDWLGRTVLHLACSALDPAATEYVRMLLAHPGINANLQDMESHWTPLHRALYSGNLSATYVSQLITVS